MSTNVSGTPQTRTVEIESNLASKVMHFVKYNVSAGKQNVVQLAVDATKVMYLLAEGVDGSTTPGVGTILVEGLAKMKLGGTVQAGQFLTANSDGEAIAVTAAGQHYGAIAQEEGVDGDEVLVQVQQGVYYTV
jgi:hypothetical protein